MSIVKSQIGLCMQYTVEELLGDDRNTDSSEILSCKRTLTNEHVDSPIDLDLQDLPTPVLSDHINACDLSLPSEITTSSETLRRVSLSSCTCLFPTCWGLPCRHILLVYLHKNITKIPDGIISSLWLVKGNLVNELITTYRRVPEHNVSLFLQTKDERYAILCNDFKNVARIASLTSENTEKVRIELMKISRLLQYNELDIVAPRIMTTKRKKSADEFPKWRR